MDLQIDTAKIVGKEEKIEMDVCTATKLPVLVEFGIYGTLHA